jgi:AcrR family transcriptional regulator
MPRRARTSPRRAPLQKRAEDTVDVLIRATEIAFTRFGIHGATTNRIAEIAGVSIGTLYHYFPTKEALVQAVVHRLWSAEMESLSSRAHLLDELPLHEAILELSKGLAGVVLSRQELVRRWYTEASNLGDQDAGIAMAHQASAIVERALANRRDQVRPRDLALASHLVVITAMHIIRAGPRDFPTQLSNGELATELAQMLSRYLLKTPPED